ncbi:MAG: hypothetical protein JNJ77_04030 [Planctomycetia bacterium]|nr:hypothetical protein [Planctomycetia bacterium]
MTFYLEGITASSTFGDVQLNVDYVGGTIPMQCIFDLVNVTVFGVNQDGFFSGNQQPDNRAKFVMYDASYNENGQISWDKGWYPVWEAFSGVQYCKYIRDCMEVQGTVFPPRESNPSQYYGNSWDPSDPEPYPPNPVQAKVKFGMTREKIKVSWRIFNGTNQWVADPAPIEWGPDHGQGGLNDGVANIVTNTSHIYFVDAVGLDKRNINELGYGYYVKYINFRNAVNVNIYGDPFQCSDYYRWHSVIKAKPSPDNITVTRARNEVLSFGEHWAVFPNAAPTDHGSW